MRILQENGRCRVTGWQGWGPYWMSLFLSGALTMFAGSSYSIYFLPGLSFLLFALKDSFMVQNKRLVTSLKKCIHNQLTLKKCVHQQQHTRVRKLTRVYFCLEIFFSSDCFCNVNFGFGFCMKTFDTDAPKCWNIRVNLSGNFLNFLNLWTSLSNYQHSLNCGSGSKDWGILDYFLE